MQRKPIRQQVAEAIQKLADSTPFTPARRDFAITAIYCQMNEGIEPHIVPNLKFETFNFDERWVEFTPRHCNRPVRRQLSDDTRNHLLDIRRKLKAVSTDFISPYRALPTNGRTAAKDPGFSQAVRDALDEAGCSVGLFTTKQLKWIWIDENPHLSGEERRVRLVAEFVLKWAKPFQQGALLDQLFAGTDVLRPSWAYPDWHKDFTSAKGAAPEVSQASVLDPAA